MRLKPRYVCLCALSLFLACGSSAIAGAIFPCPLATSSKNGNFLVLADRFVTGQQSVSLLVVRRERFINEYQRIVAPTTFWSGEPGWWNVVLDADGIDKALSSCPLPLITDDGEFLILVHVNPGYSGDTPVLRIYRRPAPNPT